MKMKQPGGGGGEGLQGTLGDLPWKPRGASLLSSPASGTSQLPRGPQGGGYTPQGRHTPLPWVWAATESHFLPRTSKEACVPAPPSQTFAVLSTGTRALDKGPKMGRENQLLDARGGHPTIPWFPARHYTVLLREGVTEFSRPLGGPSPLQKTPRVILPQWGGGGHSWLCREGWSTLMASLSGIPSCFSKRSPALWVNYGFVT